MTGGAFELGGVTRLDQPLGLYRRGRLRDLGARARRVETVADLLADQPEVKPIGLGARDSLRLEAGLPLYGHDLDHDDHAGRGGPRLRLVEAPPRRGRLSRLAPDRRRSWPTGRSASASASPSRAASRSAKARWWSTARAMRSARSPAAASRRASRRRSPWPMCPPPRPSRARAISLAQRGKIFTGDGRADAVRPPPLPPQGSRPHERLLYQGA